MKRWAVPIAEVYSHPRAKLTSTPRPTAPIEWQSTYERSFPNGKGYSRYIYGSYWRAFSEPPQDTPLAVCDARSVRPNEGTTNTLFVVDMLPDEATMLTPMPNEDWVPEPRYSISIRRTVGGTSRT